MSITLTTVLIRTHYELKGEVVTDTFTIGPASVENDQRSMDGPTLESCLPRAEQRPMSLSSPC